MNEALRQAFRWIGPGGPMPEVVRPRSVAEAQEWIREVNRPGVGILPVGSGRYWFVGDQPLRATHVLSTEHWDRILDYSPADLTMTVEAGCRLTPIEGRLASENQFLPFFPVDGGESTIGGVVAAAIEGPSAALGRPRDHLIGIEVLHPEGILSHAGGRVVKNVAGYDLCKLYTGSLGTLGIITQLTFKLKPKPPESWTLLFEFDDLAEALEAARRLRDEIHPAALEIEDLREGCLILLGLLDSPAASAWKRRRVSSLAAPVRSLTAGDERVFWQERARRARRALDPDSGQAALQVSAPLALFTEVAAALGSSFSPCELGLSYLRSCLLAWVEEDGRLVEGLEDWRRRWRTRGVSTVLWKASADLKRATSAWDIDPRQAAIEKAIRDRFDPCGILNPGRMGQ